MSNVNTFTLKLLHNFVSLDILLKTIIQNSTLICLHKERSNIPNIIFLIIIPLLHKILIFLLSVMN